MLDEIGRTDGVSSDKSGYYAIELLVPSNGRYRIRIGLQRFSSSASSSPPE